MASNTKIRDSRRRGHEELEKKPVRLVEETIGFNRLRNKSTFQNELSRKLKTLGPPPPLHPLKNTQDYNSMECPQYNTVIIEHSPYGLIHEQYNNILIIN